MHIPFDEERGIHPQDDTFLDREAWDLNATPREKFPLLLHYHPLVIYRHQVLKQADIVLAMFLLGDEFSEEQKRRNFDYYDPLTTGDSSLSACVQGIIAAEIGRERQALEYFQHALLMDLGNVAGNASERRPYRGRRRRVVIARLRVRRRPGLRRPPVLRAAAAARLERARLLTPVRPAGRSGSGSPTTWKATSLARAIHWRSSSGASPTCSARAPAWPSSSRRRDMDVRLACPRHPEFRESGERALVRAVSPGGGAGSRAVAGVTSGPSRLSTAAA